MKSLKNQRGITLIALIITVIVLIILASITISAITGKNGIIQKSRAAKANTEGSDELERRKTEEAKNEIKDDLKNDEDDVTRTETVSSQVLVVWNDDGHAEERPESVTIQLYRDGQASQTKKLTVANNWRSDLGVLSQNHDWTISEMTAVDNYTVSITYENYTFIVTYTWADSASTPDDPTPDIPDKYKAVVTFNVINGTWSGGTYSQSTWVVLTDSNGNPATPAEGGTYKIPDGMVPTSTPNVGYSVGYWNSNPSGATINGNTTFTYTYSPIPVIPPPDPGTDIPDPDVPL